MKTYYFKKSKKQRFIDRIVLSALACTAVISSALLVTDISASQFENQLSTLEEYAQDPTITKIFYEPPEWYQNAIEGPVEAVMVPLDIQTTYVSEQEKVPEIVEETETIMSLAAVTFDPASNDITNVTGATAEQFNALIEKISEHRNFNSPINGMGEHFVTIEQERGISGTALLSIMTWETGVGEDEAADNNLAGIKERSGDYRNFETHEECILYLGELMEKYTTVYDLHTWHEIGNSYCKRNSSWPGHISSTTDMYNEWIDEIMSV